MSCPDCFRGGRATGDPKGQIATIHGVETYVAGGASSTSTSGSTIIYFTDAFGLKLVNNKLLADAYAIATGFRVLVPDIIPGGGIDAEGLNIMDRIMAPVPWWNIWGQLVRAGSVLQAITYMVPFFLRAAPHKPACFGSCLEYARKIKSELPAGAKLGVAGFCWGGYQSINLSAQPATENGTERLIDAQFSAHPSQLKLPDQVVDAVTKFKTPIAIAHAEHDMALPTKQIEETEAALREKVGMGEGEGGYHYQIKIYKGVAHGFAVRAKPGDEVEAKGADDAKEQAVEWFKRWL